MSSQQNLRNNQQQGLQTTRQQSETVEKAVPVSGKLTRLPNRGSISTTDPEQATQWIEEAHELSGLVLAPFGNSVPLMPPGYGISVTPVGVTDFNDSFEGTEIYPIKGNRNKKGLLKTILDACATGMGFDWPPQWTWVEKFGDERDQDRLCQKVTVCGRYKDVDGSWKTLPPQTKEIDLREGSSEVLEVRARHLAKQLSDLPPNATPEARAERERRAKLGADVELAGPRKFIRSYAQTKARLMVIGTRMRRAYTLEELKRGPFYCFRVIQTWRSDNPDTQKRFDEAIIEREMASSRMLYGEAPPTAAVPHALPPASDEPYPQPDETGVPPQDAGVVGDDGPPAGETAAEQTEGSGAATATEQGQQTQSQSQVKQCTPVKCFGADPAALHVNACYGTAGETSDQSAPVEEQQAPWKITRGTARGLEVTNLKVRPETLKELRNLYITMLDSNGPDFAELSDEKKDLLSGELKEIIKEMRRRNIKDDGNN